MTGWVGYGWSEPIAYSYGDNVYYQDDSVYYGDQVVATAEEYAQQAEEIATSAPEVAPDKAEWMPLGVFALTPDGQASGPDPTLFLQLAISKEGIIAGTLNNSATEQTQTIEGMADKAVAARGVDRGRQDSADHGNRHRQPDRGHGAGAGPLRRRPDPAMADGAAGRADGGPAASNRGGGVPNCEPERPDDSPKAILQGVERRLCSSRACWPRCRGVQTSPEPEAIRPVRAIKVGDLKADCRPGVSRPREAREEVDLSFQVSGRWSRCRSTWGAR